MIMHIEPRYDLPWHTWRALHSEFVTFTLGSPEIFMEALVMRLGGDLSFERFMLGIHLAQVLNVSTIVDDNGVRIGIAIPVHDGPDWVLFTLDQAHHGADAEWLMTAGRDRLETELATMLDESG
jgi:hypothetical protein